jgi:tyrosyl-DNA phosphodiesterase 2
MPSASEEEMARNKIMAQAAAINSERGISNSSNILLAQLHAERLARRGTTTATTPPPSNQVDQETEPAQAPSNKLIILSYNLWFKEEVRIHSRMQAISEIISSTVDGYPDVLCFQEVTPLIYRILSSTPWWSRYTVRPVATDLGNMSYFTVLLWKTKLSASGSGGDGSVSYASLPFENSQMGRDLKAVKLPTPLGFPLCVATSHLESPISNEQIFSSTRQAQCKEALEVLDIMGEDVMFIGDMNWNEENDGEPPLPPSW